ncbi:hypothetical protein FA041_04320 [Escherichia coli]|nr:hypothetical protein [Escherichia coli]
MARSVGVPAADVTNWPAGTVNIAVSGTNTAGTTTSISHPVTVDLAAVAITINTLSTDDVINAAEKAAICSSPAPPPMWKRGKPSPLSSAAKLHHHGCRGRHRG